MIMTVIYSYATIHRGPAPGRPGWSGADKCPQNTDSNASDLDTAWIQLGYNLDTTWIHGGRSGPLGRPFSRSCVGSPCSMACSIGGAESAKNAHIWPFSGVLAYVNVSIIVLSCADLGPLLGMPGRPVISPGWYFFTAARRMYHPILQFLVKISLTGVCPTPTIALQATKTALFSVFTS